MHPHRKAVLIPRSLQTSTKQVAVHRHPCILWDVRTSFSTCRLLSSSSSLSHPTTCNTLRMNIALDVTRCKDVIRRLIANYEIIDEFQFPPHHLLILSPPHSSYSSLVIPTVLNSLVLEKSAIPFQASMLGSNAFTI